MFLSLRTSRTAWRRPCRSSTRSWLPLFVQMHGEVQEKRVLAVSFLDRSGQSQCLGFLCYVAAVLTFLQKHRPAFKDVGSLLCWDDPSAKGSSLRTDVALLRWEFQEIRGPNIETTI